MRQLQYIAVRQTKRGEIKARLYAISLLQAVDQARLKSNELRSMGISGAYRVVGYVDPEGQEVLF
jgi:hypothetical protein